MFDLATWVAIVTVLLVAEVKVTTSAVPCSDGDTAGIIRDGKTCVELVTADNAECYNATLETTCCASCNGAATSNSNCLYGDSATCFAFLCASYTDIASCCGTCSSFIASSSTSTTPTSTSSTSSASTTTSQDTTAMTSTSVLNSTESSTTGSNGGLIAGAVLGSIVGVTVLAAGAFFAVKILKKKGNKVDDENSSRSSSGIPDKHDRYPNSIHEKLDICTVLQEKLDTESETQESVKENNHEPPEELVKFNTDQTEKAENYYDTIKTAKPLEVKHSPIAMTSTLANSLKKSNLNEQISPEGKKLQHEDTVVPEKGETSAGFGLVPPSNDGMSTEILNKANGLARRPSLPPLRETPPDDTAIRERLPPISSVMKSDFIFPSFM